MASRKIAHPETTAAWEEVELIVEGEHSDPFHVLGAHPVEGKPAVAVRAFLPGAVKVWVIRGTTDAAKDENFGVPSADGSLLQQIHPEGFFEAVFPGQTQVFPYRLRAEDSTGHAWEFEDPYRFPPVLTDFDLHLLGEGTHYRNWEKLGAKSVERAGYAG